MLCSELRDFKIFKVKKFTQILAQFWLLGALRSVVLSIGVQIA